MLISSPMTGGTGGLVSRDTKLLLNLMQVTPPEENQTKPGQNTEWENT